MRRKSLIVLFFVVIGVSPYCFSQDLTQNTPGNTLPIPCERLMELYPFPDYDLRLYAYLNRLRKGFLRESTYEDA
jgi:hypothetical protein